MPGRSASRSVQASSSRSPIRSCAEIQTGFGPASIEAWRIFRRCGRHRPKAAPSGVHRCWSRMVAVAAALIPGGRSRSRPSWPRLETRTRQPLVIGSSSARIRASNSAGPLCVQPLGRAPLEIRVEGDSAFGKMVCPGRRGRHCRRPSTRLRRAAARASAHAARIVAKSGWLIALGHTVGHGGSTSNQRQFLLRSVFGWANAHAFERMAKAGVAPLLRRSRPTQR